MEFKKPTILVVDDMTTTLLLLHDLLKDTYEVKIAKSGTKALEILESPNDIDLILLDIEMPDINGYDVCKRIKNNETIKNIPIIFITAMSTDSDKVLALELDADDYIVKPINTIELTARVASQLSRCYQYVNNKEENFAYVKRVMRNYFFELSTLFI